MKTPTTPYSISVQENVKINRDFLLSRGFKLTEEKPLYESFKLIKNINVVCSIGLYGEFSIYELDWISKTPEKSFVTINHKLTEADFDTICRYLNIEL